MFAGLLAGVALAPAWARSTVTLYGLADEGINYTSNVRGHALWEMMSGAAQGSRWGLKGSEDLGGDRRRCFRWKTA